MVTRPPVFDHHGYRFEDFFFDLDRHALIRDGEEIPLRPRSFDVLRVLIENRGRLVSRDDLMQSVWGEMVVIDNSLNQCIAEIRRAIGDTGQEMIRTVPRQGYLFDVSVTEVTPAEPVVDEIERPSADSPPPPRDKRPLAIPFAAIVLMVLGVFVWQYWSGRSLPVEPAPAAAGNQIAVLPFADLSPGGDSRYFADGLTEEIINALAAVGELSVISRTSSFALRDANAGIAEVARLLNADYIVEGSIRKSGSSIRITAQLIQADADTQLWSATYDQALSPSETFEIQETIARSIVEKLAVHAADGATYGSEGYPPSVDAYDLYLVALARRRNARSHEDIAEIADLLDQALRIQPDFAEALALRAVAEISLSDYAFGARIYTTADALPRAKEWIEAARQQAPGAPEVLYALAQYYDAQDEVPTAESYYREAIRARPNFTYARVNLARTFLREARYDEAVEQLETALEFDPANAGPNAMLFNTYVMMNELAKAEATLERWGSLAPDEPAIGFHRARYLRFAGRLEESLELIRALESTDTGEELRDEIRTQKLRVLLRLAEYGRVLEEAGALDRERIFRIKALILQGRHRDAVAAAEEWQADAPDSAWPVDALLHSLFYSGLWSDYVATFERNFHYSSLFRDLVYLPAASMALGPYLASGHRRVEWFRDTAWRVVDIEERYGSTWPRLEVYAARLLVLEDREDDAITRLQRAVEEGFFSPWIPIDPVLARLSHREEYAALVETIEGRINEQRAELGLAPAELTRAVPTGRASRDRIER